MAKISEDPVRIADTQFLERAVLGTLLSDIEAQALIFSKIDPQDDFYDPLHQRIFWAALDQRNAGDPVDFVSIYDRLKPMSADVLADLADCAMPGAIEHWIEKLHGFAARRQAQALLQDAMDSLGVFDTELVARFQNMSDEVIRLVSPRGGVGHIREGMVETLKNIDKNHGRKIVRTGLSALDNLVGGFFPGQLWVVAGRTSMGKSSLAQNMLLAVAHAGHGAGYVSIEDNNDELRKRLLAIESREPISDLCSGNISRSQAQRISEASDILAGLPISYVEQERLWSRVKAKIQLLKFENPSIAVIFIDYLGLIENQQYKNRWEAIGAVSRELKGLAQSMGVALVAVCQISRETERRKDHLPMLADLRDAGAIEQDADVICLLYRPAYYDKHADSMLAQIAVAKQRNGPTGSVEVNFDTACVKFFDRS